MSDEDIILSIMYNKIDSVLIKKKKEKKKNST